VIDTAQDAPETVILTEDEAWMYLQATTMRVWAACGQTPTVGVDPGRRKAGFYGTLNLHTGQEIVTRTATFNAEVSAQHLQQILDTFPGVPILLFWDRATWHRGPPIRELLASNPRLEIIQYPVAAPDLNPQENVWKQTRQVISHNHLTAKLPDLADDFEDHLLSHTFESSFLDRYGYRLVCPFLN
jgi:transposase